MGEQDTHDGEDVSQIMADKPNMFDAEAFGAWRERAPDGHLWDDYSHLEQMRLDRDQLVAETRLSEREAEVAILRAKGYGYEAISEQINVSPSTAAEYGYRAREKAIEAVRTIRVLKNLDKEWFLEVISDEDR